MVDGVVLTLIEVFALLSVSGGVVIVVVVELLGPASTITKKTYVLCCR